MALVERNEALTRLDGLLADAAAGRGRVALVTGTVATGKSALLSALADRAADGGALAVTAIGSRAERDLPLALLSQLFHDAPLPPPERERAMNLLFEGTRAAMVAEDMADGHIDVQIVHGLCTILLDLAERHPIALLVDDVHHADRASLLCLSYLARRVRPAHLLVVFSRSTFGRTEEPDWQNDLLRPGHGVHIPLEALSGGGVRLLAEELAGAEVAERLADRWYQLCGGNPLLLKALVADHRQAVAETGAEPDEPVVGEAYAAAVMNCLRQAEPRLLEVARGVAVLADPESLDQLTSIDPEHAQQAVRSLTAAGLLSMGAFRHPAARAAVLADVGPEQRAELHRRAAVLAYDRGASTREVAEHLVHASDVTQTWGVTVLEDAARQALRDGRVEAAVSYLKLAWKACTDDKHRVRIMTTLVRAEWRINPSTSAGYLPELSGALEKGVLRGSDALVLAKALLWHGQFGEAEHVLDHLGARAGELDADTSAELAATRPWLRCTYAPFVAHLPKSTTPVSTVSASRRFAAARTLASVISSTPGPDVSETVERILRGSRLDEMSLDTVESALLALTYAGHADRAAGWCDMFVEEAYTRRAPSRQARLAVVRAEVAVRTGNLPGAARYARTALEIMPPASWGVAIGHPLSLLIIASLAMGDFDDVREQLDQPVPEAMFQTRYGLHYLQARGRYSLATDHLGLALRDFQRCGDLMAAWGVDAPGLVAWRSDAAETYLRMGRPGQARRLAEEQLNRCTKEMPRAQGVGLRLLAATGQLRHRPMLLRQAADLLQNSGDLYELSRTLVDLAQAYHALGESRRAGMIGHRARTLAEQCEATPLRRALSQDEELDTTGDPAAPEVAGGAVAMLSDAERRVAALAAVGYTNREIADKLYITTSTVEQHLTRTYRKLNVTRRSDLPANLDTNLTITT
ncbi:LuxR family transcriptional regulator [Paractinoplanes abujensis]|uniref:DNA-binding CsgD family transcriptional regulator n=1 Tax=Paractinoplanes abujensis TaxID=882441 RepID=A0A7W7CTK0_9ACTN|nr:LuxR family transcriptional regulator [Actinoplanes abujensis]MBB4693033.1 DNA-binding CsgD family transcriptional regulator [Actinoplanes abujensis]GID24983.1 LuxR family transcriptional regulator [Actinoplanes abujensis]